MALPPGVSAPTACGPAAGHWRAGLCRDAVPQLPPPLRRISRWPGITTMCHSVSVQGAASTRASSRQTTPWHRTYRLPPRWRPHPRSGPRSCQSPSSASFSSRSQSHQHLAGTHCYLVGIDLLAAAQSGTGGEVESSLMQRADHALVSEQAVGQRATAMWTGVGQRVPSSRRVEDGNASTVYGRRTSFAHWNVIDRTDPYRRTSGNRIVPDGRGIAHSAPSSGGPTRARVAGPSLAGWSRSRNWRGW